MRGMTSPMLVKLQDYVTPQLAFFLVAATLALWLFYRLLLKDMPANRHIRLRGLFANVVKHQAAATLFFALFILIPHFFLENPFELSLRLYLGFALVGWGLLIFIKIARIFSFEYLFFNNMRAGVPLLVVNLITFVLSILAIMWFLSQFLDLKLGTLLATSTFVSVVVGLALQDTIGNLFSGFALQLDKPFRIGDWIEVESETGKWVGQVFEVSWRATTLYGFLDEVHIIPNKVLSNAFMTNYSGRLRPVLRSQFFRIPFDVSVQKVESTLLAALQDVPGLKVGTVPRVLITETTESWLLYKIIYYVEDFGQMFIVGDEVIRRSAAAFQAAGIPIARHRVDVLSAGA